jgi:hypothetical protein
LVNVGAAEAVTAARAEHARRAAGRSAARLINSSIFNRGLTGFGQIAVAVAIDVQRRSIQHEPDARPRLRPEDE